MFYILAVLLLFMLVSALFAWPTATLIGRFFFDAFGLFALYIPLYLYIIGNYLKQNHDNPAYITAINLTFLPFITLVLFTRFLTGNATTDWELDLFWRLSKNHRPHFIMIYLVVLLLELTLISYFWYRSRLFLKDRKIAEENLNVDEKIHVHINQINTIDNSQNIFMDGEEIPPNPHPNQHDPSRILLRVESHLKKSKHHLSESLHKIKIALFGAEKVEKEWQEEVEDLLGELKSEPRFTPSDEDTKIETTLSDEKSTLHYLQADPQIKELLEDPMVDAWHEEATSHNPSHVEVAPFSSALEDEPEESLQSEEKIPEPTPHDPLNKEDLSQIINQHLGIVEPDPAPEISPAPEESFIPKKLERPEVNVENDFKERRNHLEDDLLPPHLRESFFTQEEQDALHAISEEIVENAHLESQIAELIDEANHTLDKIIANTQMPIAQSNELHQEYAQLVSLDEEFLPTHHDNIHDTFEEPQPEDAPSLPESEEVLPEEPLHEPYSSTHIDASTTQDSPPIPLTPAQERAHFLARTALEHPPEATQPTPFIALDDPTFDDIDLDPQEEIQHVGALPSIKEDWENSPFLQQTLVEQELEEAVDSPTTPAEIANYQFPPADILQGYEQVPYWHIDEETEQLASILESTLKEFKIEGTVTNISKGPAITMFELLPASGVKLSRIEGLADNIAFRLAAKSVRIVAPIPGKQAVGVEIPNKRRSIVSFQELIDDTKMHDPREIIPIILGKDIAGDNQVMDLAKTPHLLIAGATGSGKSVCVNGLISSILFTRKPSEVRLLLIDPKVVELKPFNDVPHLLTPVITDPKRALQAIQWVNEEMDRRYLLLDNLGVRNIVGYNLKIQEMQLINPPLPYLVVVIDEFADLMATGAKELEGLIARLAAKSRAAGIHLVLATQRPSVDVITGLIKANFPSRIAFMVAGKMDSRVILDTNGAEQLLGKGDMLFVSSWNPIPTRIQGAFLSDNEVEQIADFVKSQGAPNYIDDEIFYDDDDNSFESNDGASDDILYDQAVEVVLTSGKASASYLQRRFKIGYNRAATLIEMMESRGIVGPANGSKPREILR
ncbi:DNA translocase FtsK [Entomospira culicis]|uniref:DNA translocase FtsK n=1 Tax=Entomospira culicis TaxID=2719989 RepID=UPI001FE42E27